MNNQRLRNGFTLVELMIVVAMIALLAAVLVPREAKAQVVSQNTITATNISATVAAGTVSNKVSFIPITQGKGASLQWLMNASSGTAAATVYISPCVSTNFTSTNQIWLLTQAAGSTTTNCVTTNWTAAQLAGFGFLNIWGVTNAGGGGTLTNGPITFTVPLTGGGG